MIIIQYYNVLCAKFHLKNHLQKEVQHGTCWGFYTYSKRYESYKVQSQPNQMMAHLYAGQHVSMTPCVTWTTGPSGVALFQTGFKEHKSNFPIHSYSADRLFGAFANSFPNSIFFNLIKVTLHITWFLPQIIWCCWFWFMWKRKKKCYPYFFSLWDFHNCFPKQVTWDRLCQNSLHICSIFHRGGSFHLLFLLPSWSLNQQTTLSPLLESVFLS